MLVTQQGLRAVRRSAFTLLEVLIVAMIILILAGAGGLTVMKYLEDAKQSRATADIKTLSTAAQAFQIKNSSPPQTLAELAQPPAEGGRAYIETTEILRDPWGNPYQYDAAGPKNSGNKPDIWTVTPDGKTISNFPQ